MTKRVLFDKEREEELKGFWMGTQPIYLLAAKWGCSTAYISITAKALGLPSRQKRKVDLRSHALRDRIQPQQLYDPYLVTEATKRYMTVEKFKRHLIKRICADKLVNAVLDDAEELEKTNKVLHGKVMLA